MPFIRLNAGNDRNGNPRRAFVLIDAGSNIIGAWDEGYKGFSVVPDSVLAGEPEVISAFIPTIPTTRSYLRSILKQYGS